jgi:hypothetical protein
MAIEIAEKSRIHVANRLSGRRLPRQNPGQRPETGPFRVNQGKAGTIEA